MASASCRASAVQSATLSIVRMPVYGKYARNKSLTRRRVWELGHTPFIGDQIGVP